MLIFNTSKIDFMIECLEEAVEDHIESNLILLKEMTEVTKTLENLTKRIDKLEKKLDNKQKKTVRKVRK